jgi:hypothetical protein
LIASTTNRKVAVWVGGHPLDQSAMTFTLFGRPQFMLGRGLRMLVRKQPKLFETIIVHELAHVINRDIVINSMTFAAFRAVVFIFFLYFVVQIAELFAIFLSSELPQMFYVPEPQRIAWSQIDSLARASALAPIFVLLVLEHRRLLRIREHYADWRTASLIGEDGLAALLTSPNSGDKSARYRLLARHPSAEDRFRALKNPSAFLRAGSFDLAFAAFMTALTAYWVGHAYPPAIRDLKDLETVLLPLIAFTIFFTAYLSMIFSGLIFRELVVCSIRTESEYWKTWILGGASIVLGVELVYLFDEESNFF